MLKGVSSSGSGAPSGPAGGALAGTYPNPTIASGVTLPGNPNFSGLTASQVIVTDGSKNAASLAYGTSSSASSLLERDANANSFSNNTINNATATASAGGTTVLTVASSRYQALTGSSNQTYQLPDATTLTLGPWFVFNNNSSGNLIINNNGGSTLYTVPPGGIVECGPTSISTANGSWDFHGFYPSTVTWSSGPTGLIFNTVLNTTPQINAGASSSTNPSFVPQRGSSTTGYGGDSTHLYGIISGTASFTSTATTFNIPSGAAYQINGTSIFATANSWSAVQTFNNSDIKLLGSSTGATTFTSANAGASNFTLTLPAITDTVTTNTSSSIAFTGGTIDGATIGGTTPCTVSGHRPQVTISGTTRTLALTDADTFQITTNGSATTVTVDTNANVAFATNTEIDFFQQGAGQVTFAAAGGVTIQSKGGNLKLTGQYSGATLKKLATNTWSLVGDLSA